MDEMAARQGRSGRVPAAAPSRSAPCGRSLASREGGQLGDAAVAVDARRSRRERPAARGTACFTKATTATSHGRRGRGRSARREITAKRIVVAQDGGPIVESGRDAQSDRRRRAPGPEPGARRRSDVGRPEGHLHRLANLSQPVARVGDADDRERAHRPSRRRGHGRGRDGDHAGGCGGRQCGVRRNRRPAARGRRSRRRG